MTNFFFGVKGVKEVKEVKDKCFVSFWITSFLELKELKKLPLRFTPLGS